MIYKFKTVTSDSLSPYENLAKEKYITSHIGENEIVLFIWQNADTVVIGRNQNCWRECRVSNIIESGGKIARRPSGGGAVYHDTGNLNFSFIYSEGAWSTEKGLAVIAAACREHGIEATVSGRNDILVNGAKFSGNAFYSMAGEGGIMGICHHGCILISADTGRMESFLNVSKEKLESKGVRSVRSRVVNLGSIRKELTPSLFAQSLKKAFGAADEYIFPDDAADKIQGDAEFLSSDEWIFGRRIDFTDSFGARFPFGEISFNFKVSAGTVTECKVYSDAMDETLPEAIEEAFTGKAFSARELESALPSMESTVKNHISRLLYDNI